jgi:phage tail-like protein
MTAEDGPTASVFFAGALASATRHRPVRLSVVEGDPRPASCRAYLRSRLPAIYQESDFGLRFVGGLERSLDPVVAVLDVLPAYFDPGLAPEDVLDVLALWLGVELDESWPNERRRELVRKAGEAARRRGTRRGLELVLSIAFPDLPLRVEGGGSVTWSPDPDAAAPDNTTEFVVVCDVPLDNSDQAAVARAIEQAKPAHVSYRFEVRTQPRRQ